MRSIYVESAKDWPQTTFTFGDQLYTVKIKYGDRDVYLITDETWPDAWGGKIMEVFATAERQGFLPKRDLVYHLNCMKSELALGGIFGIAGKSDQLVECSLNINTTSYMGQNMSNVRQEQDILRSLEHETWHCVDAAGDHSQPIDEMRGSFKHSLQSSRDDLQSMRELEHQYQHGALSAQDLHKSTLKVCLEHSQAYRQNPQEMFVHERMSQARGLESGSVEAWCHSHGMATWYASFLCELSNRGMNPNLVRGAMKRMIASFQYPDPLRAQLAGLGSHTLWQDL